MISKKNDCSAFTGLEAAIVLIAFVTVAAVFSYVVLGLGFSTTQKSQEVIFQSMGQVSSVMMVTGGVYGISDTGTTIDMINFSFRPSAGGGAIDFSKITITFSTANRLQIISPMAGVSSPSTLPGTWAVIQKLNEQGTPNNLLEPGEQFTISVHPLQGLTGGEKFSLEILPAGGAATGIQGTIPAQISMVTQLY